MPKVKNAKNTQCFFGVKNLYEVVFEKLFQLSTSTGYFVFKVTFILIVVYSRFLFQWPY